VLAAVEGRLEHFRQTLGSVSDDIRSLDVRSAVLSTRLENRARAESALGGWLEDTTVPPELIRDVRGCTPDDPESCIPALRELQDKLAGMQAFENYQSLAAYPLLAVRGQGLESWDGRLLVVDTASNSHTRSHARTSAPTRPNPSQPSALLPCSSCRSTPPRR